MLGFEYLVPFQQQKIELGFLPVTQEEVFGNGGLQNRLHLVAGLNVKGRAVVHPAIGDAQAVQKVIASHFRRAPPLTVPGAAGVAGSHPVSNPWKASSVHNVQVVGVDLPGVGLQDWLMTSATPAGSRM